jgi:hypothetical protein
MLADPCFGKVPAALISPCAQPAVETDQNQDEDKVGTSEPPRYQEAWGAERQGCLHALFHRFTLLE